MDNSWNIQTEDSSKIKKLRVTTSLILATVGLVVIASQVIPLTKSYLDGIVEQKMGEIKVAPVPDSYKTYIENEFAYYDPGKSYFANLSQQLGNLDTSSQYSFNPDTATQVAVKVDKDYDKTMLLSISSIGIEKIKVTPNVESSDEKIYNRYLKSGVAHFKGTPLPGDGGNTFIYGHSAVESFFSRHSNNPETIFSRLNDIDIGQKVLVERDGKVIEYVVRNKKIVSPDDFTILQPVQDKETVTMMTCWPLGIGTKRLIVVAERRI